MRKTNQQVVKDCMAFSRYGALAEAFVVDALIKASESAASLTDAQLEEMSKNSLIHPVAWRGVGQEIKAKLDAAYNPRLKAA